MPVLPSTKVPLPFVARTKSPSRSSTSENATETTGEPLSVSRSKLKLPWSETSPMPSVTPSPETRTNGPAGRSISIVKASPANVCETGAPVVLISSASVPASVTSSTFCSSTCALSLPATPPGRITNAPSPSDRTRKFLEPSPSERLTLETAILIAVPPVTATCSNAKSPASRCPAIFSDTPVPATRTYGPAGIETDTVEPPTWKLSATSAPCC